jgi:tuftelin-interacting protein 11
VESKLRPKGAVGIAYGGFKERTKQAVAEDRRKGKKVSDDEDEDRPRRHGKKQHGEGEGGNRDKSEAWKKKSKPKKVTVEHKSYEEIVREAGLDTPTAHQAGAGPIIDATGATPREVSSISAVSWTPSTDTMRIPEIRHNLRLMVDITNHDLLGLAREGKLLEEKRRQGRLEEVRLARRVKEEAELISRLGEMKIVVDELVAVAKIANQTAKSQLSEDYVTLQANAAPSSLEALSPFVERFIRDFVSEYQGYKVDEIVVGAMAPLFRAELMDWNPLEDPARWTSILARWKGALRMSGRQKDEELALASFYGAPPPKDVADIAQAMTPWEALLWHAWLPKLRSAIKCVDLFLHSVIF